jgi:flagellar hook assembly protein FlgD
MRVFDLSGRLVRTLANEDMAAANHSVIWDGADDNGRPLGAGVYFCRLEAQGQVLTQKIMMVE